MLARLLAHEASALSTAPGKSPGAHRHYRVGVSSWEVQPDGSVTDLLDPRPGSKPQGDAAERAAARGDDLVNVEAGTMAEDLIPFFSQVTHPPLPS